MKKMNVLGIELADYALKDALKITSKFMKSGALNTVFYLSTHILVEAGDHLEQKEWLEQMDLTIPGEPDIVRTQEHIGRNRIHEIEKNDFLREFLHRSVRNQNTFFLLSDTPESLRTLREGLLSQQQELNIVGMNSLEEIKENFDQLINDINDLAPDGILSCIGYPAQARIMQEQKKRINAEVWIGLLKDWNKNISKPPVLYRISNGIYKRIFRYRVKSYQNKKAE